MKSRPNPLLRITAAVALACAGSAYSADVTLSTGTYTDTQSYDNGNLGPGQYNVVTFGSGANYTFSGDLTLPIAWNRIHLNSGAALNVAGSIRTNLTGVSLNGGTLTTGGLRLGDGPNWAGSTNDGKQNIEWGDSVINGSTIIANQSNDNFISLDPSPDYPGDFGNWLWINGDGATIDSNGFNIGNTMNTYGGGGLTKTGAGTLSLTASNNFTGNTNINAGVLEVTSTGKLYGGGYTTAPTITVSSGTTLKLNGWDYDSAGSLGGLDFSRDRLVVNGGTIEFTGDSNSTIGGAAGRNFTVGTGGATLKASSPSGQRWFIAENTLYGYGNLVNDNGLTLTGDGDGEIQKIIEGTGSLTKSGSGTWTLGAVNTYDGATTVSAGTLLVTGALGNTAVTVNGGTFGGTGTVGGSFSLNSGFFHVADLADPLAVTGTITLFSGFGVDDLAGLDWGSVADGTYTLISGTLGEGVFDALANNSLGTAHDIDGENGNRVAYFKEGSLQLVVIPEPRAALLGSLGMLALLRRRRR